MTETRQKMLDAVSKKVADAKQKIADAQDILMEAAAACKDDPMEDRLYSVYDGLEDLRFNLGKDLREWANDLQAVEGEAS